MRLNKGLVEKAIPVFDNMSNSVLNFCAAVVIIKYLGADQYGNYVLFLVTQTLLLAVSTAITSNQFLVFYPKYRVFEVYTVELVQLLANKVVIAVLSASLFLFFDLSFIQWSIVFFWALFFVQKESLRFLSYSLGKKYQSFFIGLFGFFVFFVYVLFVDVVDLYLLLSFLAAVFFLQYLAFIYYVYYKGGRKFVLSFKYLRKVLGYGWFSLVSAISAWSNGNAFNYFVSMSFGPVGVAVINGCKLLVMPINILLTGFFNAFKPAWAKSYGWSKGDVGVERQVFYLTSFLIILSFAYGAVVYFFWDFLNGILFNDELIQYSYIFMYWIGYMVFITIRQGLVSVFQLRLEFKAVSKVVIPMSFFSIFATYYASSFGLESVMLAVLISEFLTLLLLYRAKVSNA